MRVPDLDWPADLFTDTIPDRQETSAVSVSAGGRFDRDLPLWPAFRGLWMRTAERLEAPGMAA